ncbi:MAG: type II toxin-antitoxin system RelB/DinJ family antitoxin [Oscillospiraceae bacterium]|nr:type II toxin-antitoxin system RelB/DinJ family antitoxin [Oscillospiraceae bacterium]
MAMEATCQIRMDGELKAQVEELYRSLGTSFSEAVRIFAKQSVREGRMPFLPSLRSWDELTGTEINNALEKSETDIAEGRVISQDMLDRRIRELLDRGRDKAV